MGQDRRDLCSAGLADKTEMYADNAQGPCRAFKVEHQTAPRFKPWQIEVVTIKNIDTGPEEQGIPMPTDTGLVAARIGHFKARFSGDDLGAKGRRALAEPFVSLLQRDNIRTHARDDSGNAIRIAPPVKPDALADVPGCNAIFLHLLKMAVNCHSSML